MLSVQSARRSAEYNYAKLRLFIGRTMEADTID
jgi:hypothetical protein